MKELQAEKQHPEGIFNAKIYRRGERACSKVVKID